MKTPDQWTHHHVQWMICPYCADLHDCAQGVIDGEAPKDGDANVCIKCARISIYDSSVTGFLRVPTDDEMAELAGNQDILRVVRSVRLANIIVPREQAKRN